MNMPMNWAIQAHCKKDFAQRITSSNEMEMQINSIEQNMPTYNYVDKLYYNIKMRLFEYHGCTDGYNALVYPKSA